MTSTISSTTSTTIQLAEHYCDHFHKNQYRRGNDLPYSHHPRAVRDILARYGYDDEATQCIALLHDLIEDTAVSIRELQERFGYEIANGVYILSRNTLKTDAPKLLLGTSHDENTLYKLRLSYARENTQRVKLADIIHNTNDLSVYSEQGRRKRIDEITSFYLPLARQIAPLMVEELEYNLEHHMKKIAQQSKGQETGIGG